MARLSRILAISTQVKHVVLLSSAHVHTNRICQVPVLLVSGWLERGTDCLRRHKHPCGFNKQGLYKVASPLGGEGDRIKLVGKGIKLGRRKKETEWKEKGKARQEGKRRRAK